MGERLEVSMRRLFGADEDFELIKKLKADVSKKTMLAKIEDQWAFILLLGVFPLVLFLTRLG